MLVVLGLTSILFWVKSNEIIKDGYFIIEENECKELEIYEISFHFNIFKLNKNNLIE